MTPHPHPHAPAAPAPGSRNAHIWALVITGIATVLPHVKTGRLKLLGVTRGQRVSLLPDVPAIAETLPGYDIVVWFGLFGPAGMPKDITARLNTEVNRVMNTPETKKTMEDMGVEVYNATPEQFLDTLRKETAYWNKAVREYNIRMD